MRAVPAEAIRLLAAGAWSDSKLRWNSSCLARKWLNLGTNPPQFTEWGLLAATCTDICPEMAGR